MTQEITTEHIAAGLQSIAAIAAAVRELGKVPSGVLYAQIMGYVPKESYDKILNILVRAGLVSVTNDVLAWTGPAEEGV